MLFRSSANFKELIPILCYSFLQDVELNSPIPERGLDLLAHLQQIERGWSDGVLLLKIGYIYLIFKLY